MPFEARRGGAAAICVRAWQSVSRQFDGRALVWGGFRDADSGGNRMLRGPDLACGAAAISAAANQCALSMRSPARRTAPALEGKESASRGQARSASHVYRPACFQLEPATTWIAHSVD